MKLFGLSQAIPRLQAYEEKLLWLKVSQKPTILKRRGHSITEAVIMSTENWSFRARYRALSGTHAHQ